MRIIIMIIMAVFSVSGFGSGYLSPQSVQNCMDGKSYAVRERPCPDCLEIKPGEDCAMMSLQDVQVDDKSKPLYGPKLNLSEGHADLESCRAAQEGHCEALDPDPGYAVRPVCADAGGGSYEIYCAARAPRGYEQKTVQRLLPDAAKQAQRDAIAQVKQRVRNQARACYVKHRDEIMVAGDVIPCQKALYEFVREILGQLNQ